MEVGREKMADAFFYVDRVRNRFSLQTDWALKQMGSDLSNCSLPGAFQHCVWPGLGAMMQGSWGQQSHKDEPPHPHSVAFLTFHRVSAGCCFLPCGPIWPGWTGFWEGKYLPSSHSKEIPALPPLVRTLAQWWPGFEPVTSRWMALYLITNSPEPPASSSHQEQEDLLRVGAEVQPGALNSSTELLPQL